MTGEVFFSLVYSTKNILNVGILTQNMTFNNTY